MPHDTRLRCPRCIAPLDRIEHHGWRASVCASCHGVFTSRNELLELVGPGITLLDRARVVHLPAMVAPHCARGCGPLQTLVARESGNTVEIDACDRCSGLWFDRGEIEAVRRAGQALAAQRRRETRTARADTDARAELARHVPTERGDGLFPYLFQFFSGLPIEGTNPLYRQPFLTWLLIAACAAVFGLELKYGEAWVHAYALTPSTVDGLASFLRQSLGSMFLHGGLMHLLGNMYFLWIFGDNVEDRVGRWWFVPVYVICGFAADAAQYLADPSSTIPVVGASGAIGGLLGAYTVFFPQVRVRIAPTILTLFHRLSVPILVYLPFWFAWQVLAIMLGGGGMVAYWAHAGGFVMGGVIGVVVRFFGHDARLDALIERRRVSAVR